jgi:hypothetical protein
MIESALEAVVQAKLGHQLFLLFRAPGLTLCCDDKAFTYRFNSCHKFKVLM